MILNLLQKLSMKYKLVIFDIDGTLIDTSKGIVNSVKYAINKMHFKSIDELTLRSFIGPPPLLMYKSIFNCSDFDAMQAVLYHRDYGNCCGIYESKLYNGIIDILEYLKKNKVKIGVATLKLQTTACNILKYHKIFDYFDTVVGMDEGETLTKAETIKLVMKKTNIRDNVLMIGDSKYDENGAHEAQVFFLPVTYGFGFSLNDFQNKTYAKSPIEIVQFL